MGALGAAEARAVSWAFELGNVLVSHGRHAQAESLLNEAHGVVRQDHRHREAGCEIARGLAAVLDRRGESDAADRWRRAFDGEGDAPPPSTSSAGASP